MGSADEDGDDDWSLEVVGTASFDVDDEDWGCDEITDFGTRENLFAWKKAGKWDEGLEEMISFLKDYLENGTHEKVLKKTALVSVL